MAGTSNIIAYIALGSNLNQPQQQIKQALINLEVQQNIALLAFSGLYRSKPLKNMPQPDYYNAVVQVSTSLTALDLLDLCQQIETAQQRVREKKWAARTIDLDILLYNNQRINTKRLTIPHKEIANRAFVLLPLFDIDPDLIIPKHGQLSELIACIDISCTNRVK